MSTKKAKGKTKKVSQNDLRKMMNYVKNKRVSCAPQVVKNTNRTLIKNPDAYKKALNDRMRLQALVEKVKEPLQKTESTKSKTEISNSTNKHESNKSLKRTSEQNVETTKKPKIAKTEHTVAKQKNAKSGSLLIGDYSSDSDESEEEKPSEKAEEKMETDAPASAAQADPTSALPEGFFDDAEVDAKMRGVETPADAMDREWEEFQREIQRETDQSEQIVEEEQEMGNVDRQLEEIDEQIMHFSRVEKLSDVKDKIKRKSKKKKESSESDDERDSEDEDVDDELLDWREKDTHF